MELTGLQQLIYATPKFKGGLCMLGGIYENKGSKGSRWVVRFTTGEANITRRFADKAEAERFLTGLRYENDKGSFDAREYSKEKPLSFNKLSSQWLEKKQLSVKCYRNLVNHISYASKYFGDKNVKEIGFGDLEDFFDQLPSHLSGKSKYNIRITLMSFWRWAVKRDRGQREPIMMPDFPEVQYILGWRNTISLDMQDSIIEEVMKISEKKVWFAIRLLSTYPKIRPIELLNIKEKDIDLNIGVLRVEQNKGKKKKDKLIKLVDEDTELFKTFTRALPEVYFFRHETGHNAGKRFGKDRLYANWKRACKNLNIEGVDLYGGTKHSTVKAMRQYFRPDEIQQATGIISNSAFSRYYQEEFEDQLKIYVKRSEIRNLKSGDKKVIKLDEVKCK
jgi:hypothetical protein